MKTISKALIGTVAAGAMAMTSATPAFARDRDDGISAGDIIAGAVILGGIAAVASAAGNNRGYDRDYRYNDRNYRSGYGQGSPRAAVEQCVRAAQRDARRAGYRNAQVTQIRDVDDTRYGWKVKGTIEVQGQRGYAYGNRYNDRYDNRYDNRGYRSANYDSGRFTCDVSRGRVVDLDFRGVRGLS